MGALPQEADRRKPPCFITTEGKEGRKEVKGGKKGGRKELCHAVTFHEEEDTYG